MTSTTEAAREYSHSPLRSPLQTKGNFIDGKYRSELSETGSCTANLAKFGCGVFVRGGPECKFSGNQMWHDYQEIRDSGCTKCGFKRYDDGCEVVIDYVHDCQK